jgi:hypothetical protein
MTINAHGLIAQTSTTTGADPYKLTGVITDFGLPGLRFRDVFADGTTDIPVHVYSEDGWEYGYATLDYGATAPEDTLTMTSFVSTSNGGGKVSWATAGPRNIVLQVPVEHIMVKADNLAGLASAPAARGNLGSTTVGDAVFTAADTDAGRAALGATAVGDALLTAADAAAGRAAISAQAAGSYANASHEHSRVVVSSGQSGGTTGRVVRVSAADTWADAVSSDTAAQLARLAFKQASGVYVIEGLITGLSGRTVGATQFLSNVPSSQFTEAPPTLPGSLRRVPLGVALSATTVLFHPGLVIGS